MMEEANDDSEKAVNSGDVDISSQLQEAAADTITDTTVPVVLPAPIPPPAFTISPLVPPAAPPTTGLIPSTAPGSALSATPASNTYPTTPIVAPVSQGVQRETDATVNTGLDSDIRPLSEVPQSPTGTGIIGWFANSRLVNKMKSGVENVITTLDPGMKEFIRSGGDIDIVITSEQEAKVSAVREAFQTVFGKATIRPQASSTTTAPQPVGYTSGVKSAEERITNLRRSGEISSQQPAISVENFMAELLPDKWFDIGCLLLVDPRHQIELHVFTEAVPIPADIVSQIQDETPSDYNLRWSGYAVTLGEIIQKRMPYVDRKAWHLAYTGVSRREMISIAARTLAGIYKQRLPSSEEI